MKVNRRWVNLDVIQLDSFLAETLYIETTR